MTSGDIGDIAELGDVLALQSSDPCSIVVPAMHRDLYVAILSLEESHQNMIFSEIFWDHSCDDRSIEPLSILHHLYRDPSPRVGLHIIESEDDESLP